MSRQSHRSPELLSTGRESVAALPEHKHSLVQKMLSYEHAFILDNMEYVGNFAQCRISQKNSEELVTAEVESIVTRG